LGTGLQEHAVKVTLPPDLPMLEFDAVLMERVFCNLLENAAKYTPPGSPIDITATVRDGEVTVTVADRGPGIPVGDEQKIFEKFYRAPQGNSAGGIGLGLTICRGIVAAHGGRIWAERRPGGGAALRFTLPQEESPPQAVPGEDLLAEQEA
jgi:two-component system sensor histidine kinase KdpD